MSEQELVNLEIPKTCKECFSTPYKKPRPQCHYEKLFHLKKSVEFFKKEFGMVILSDEDLRASIEQIKPYCQQCLATIGKRAEKIHKEKQIEHLTDVVLSLKDDIDEIKNHQDERKDVSTPIYKQQKEVETPVMKVKKEKPELKIKFQKKEDNSKKKEPTGGWKFCQRNINKKNIPKFLEEFKKKNPEYSEEVNKVIEGKQSEFIKKKMNKAGRFMIMYRDFKK